MARVELVSSSSERVRRALMEVINVKQLETPRISLMLKTGRDILGKIEGTASTEAKLFRYFSMELVKVLQSSFDSAKRCRSIATKKPKIWTSFHEIRQEKLPSIWKKFLSSINIVNEDPLLQQSLNQRLFESFYKNTANCSGGSRI